MDCSAPDKRYIEHLTREFVEMCSFSIILAAGGRHLLFYTPRHVRVHGNWPQFFAVFHNNMAAAEDTFVSDVHVYTPFLRTGKDNEGTFRVNRQQEM